MIYISLKLFNPDFKELFIYTQENIKIISSWYALNIPIITKELNLFPKS